MVQSFSISLFGKQLFEDQTLELAFGHRYGLVAQNGSGKSNVIDAMLFVFGFRAKQMRQSKVSELIHSSEQFPDLQYAKVCDRKQVYFHNETLPL